MTDHDRIYALEAEVGNLRSSLAQWQVGYDHLLKELTMWRKKHLDHVKATGGDCYCDYCKKKETV